MTNETITARSIARDTLAAFAASIPCIIRFGSSELEDRERDPDCGGYAGCADGRVRNGFVATAAELHG